jgi:2-amino-4-hydroxy-6-hydroxymethyldihydropteridine diphosphokinase
MPQLKSKFVLLGLGSNIGDRLMFIRLALKRLETILKIKVVSSLYESKSLKIDDQRNYYNIVINAETCYKPYELLKQIKKVEVTLGRQKRNRWDEREIDIDIIDYNGEIMQSDMLTLPHYDMHNRSFVLLPLLEICPNYIHPQYKRNIKEMFNMVKDKLNIKRIGGLC